MTAGGWQHCCSRACVAAVCSHQAMTVLKPTSPVCLLAPCHLLQPLDYQQTLIKSFTIGGVGLHSGEYSELIAVGWLGWLAGCLRGRGRCRW